VVRAGRPPAAERDARRAQRRAALLDAAVAAVARHGEAATMTAMAAAAGVTKPVLYRYFGDRAGLYRAISERFAAGVVGALREAVAGRPAGRAALARAVDAYLAYLEANVALYRFCVTRVPAADPSAPARLRGFLHDLTDAVAAWLREVLDPDTTPATAEVLAAAVTGAVHAAADRWLGQGRPPRAALAAVLVELLWDGLGGGVAAAPAGVAGGAHRAATSQRS
jgi:AcrR family transcriptional regulator